MPFARSRSSPSIFASISRTSRNLFLLDVYEEWKTIRRNRTIVTLSFSDEDGARTVSGWFVSWWLEVNIKPKKKNDQRSNRRKFCELVRSRCHGRILDRWVNTIMFNITQYSSERANYASVIKPLRLGS